MRQPRAPISRINLPGHGFLGPHHVVTLLRTCSNSLPRTWVFCACGISSYSVPSLSSLPEWHGYDLPVSLPSGPRQHRNSRAERANMMDPVVRWPLHACFLLCPIYIHVGPVVPRTIHTAPRNNRDLNTSLPTSPACGLYHVLIQDVSLCSSSNSLPS